jgi:hypothetical protein
MLPLEVAASVPASTICVQFLLPDCHAGRDRQRHPCWLLAPDIRQTNRTDKPRKLAFLYTGTRKPRAKPRRFGI